MITTWSNKCMHRTPRSRLGWQSDIIGPASVSRLVRNEIARAQ